MSLLRAALRSRQMRIVVGAVLAYGAFQAWLTVAAPGKIAPGFPETRRVNARVVLPFAPDRFHILEFQALGRVSGTEGNSVIVRGIRRDDLPALARPYWVRRVEPLPPGG